MSSKRWQRVKLKECAKFQEGYVNPSQTVPEYFGNDVKWLRANDLNNSYVYDTSRRLSKKGFESAGKSALLFKPDTLVISKSGTIGRLGILKDYMCGNRAVINIEVDKTVCDNLFIFYSLLTKQKFIEDMGTGSVQKNLYISVLAELEIDLPPLPIQRRIADILSALDEKIELNRQTNATLEAIAQAIFKEWFVDFNFPGATGEMVESELGMIPSGWRVGKLGDFGNIVCGKTPSKANPIFFGGDVPFIKIPDMHTKVFITETEDTLTFDGAISQKNKFIHPYSLIVSCIATVGLVALTSQKSQTNQQINAIVPSNPNSIFYLYFVATDLRNVLQDLGSGGSATLNVNTSSFSNIACVIPSETILESFDLLVRPVFETILANDQETATLAALRDNLLPKLMNGEIDV